MAFRRFSDELAIVRRLGLSSFAIVIFFAGRNAVAQVPPGERPGILGYVSDAVGNPVANGSIEIPALSQNIPLDNDGSYRICYTCGRCQSAAAFSKLFALNPLSAPRMLDVSLRDPIVSAPHLAEALPDLTSALAYEDAIAQIEKKRAPQKDAKPAWQVFLESAGGAALITVVVGGVIGGILTSHLQSEAKKREIMLVQLDSEKQQRLQKEDLYLKGELTVIKEILDLVTSTSVAGDNVVLITTPRFQPSAGNPQMQSYRDNVRERFNIAKSDWKRGREVLGVTLGTYHSQNTPVFLAWLDIRKAVSDLLEVSQSVYNDYFDHSQKPFSEEEVESSCQKQRSALEQALSNFSESLFRFRGRVVENSTVFIPTGQGANAQPASA